MSARDNCAQKSGMLLRSAYGQQHQQHAGGLWGKLLWQDRWAAQWVSWGFTNDKMICDAFVIYYIIMVFRVKMFSDELLLLGKYAFTCVQLHFSL